VAEEFLLWRQTFRSFAANINTRFQMKKTVVIGASPDEQRYSHRAVISLERKGHEVVAVGLHQGNIGELSIHTELIPIAGVDTVTMYVHPRHQGYWKDYVHALKPRRVIFNPGAENPEFAEQLEEDGIDCQESCTLVMLSVGTF
jgi:hypothetical protein